MSDPIAAALREIVAAELRPLRAEIESLREALSDTAQPPNGHERMLTIDEVADRLRVGKTTVWEMRKRGDLTGRTVAGTRRVLFRESDVTALLEST